jgi:hypothetical protein
METLMPLLDHFHAPLFPLRPWESFHTFWAVAIAEGLNRLLPSRYFAAVQTHLGSRIEADVAEFEVTSPAEEDLPNGSAGSVALQTWAPPVATLTMPAVFPDDIEVQVFDTREGLQLVAVVELISPANLDRPEARRAFAAKCAAYLARGVGLLSIDIVSSHHFNLHNELVELLRLPDAFAMKQEATIYAVAYRPARRRESNQVEAWPVALALGECLPVLPLALRGAHAVPVDLEATYSSARQRSRL